jgi:hypothetical protein
MLRLLVHVEGKTEEAFVNNLLREHLIQHGYQRVGARIVGNSRLRDKRGGIRPWDAVRRDILDHLAEDPGAIATTLVDFYALPQSWPGRTEASGKRGASNKAEHLESALMADLVRLSGNRFNPRRFVPFVVMHEFEGLLFSHPENFASAIKRVDLTGSFAEIRGRFETPEDINDSEHTAPSKQILSLYPQYQKPLQGTRAATAIGLAAIRAECPHFHDWLNRLENLPLELAYLG